MSSGSMGSFYTVNLNGGAATLLGTVGRQVTALTERQGTIYGLGAEAGGETAELVTIDTLSVMATVVGALTNVGSPIEMGLSSAPDGNLWGLDDQGAAFLVSGSSGVAVQTASLPGGYECLAIPAGCGAGAHDLRVQSLEFELEVPGQPAERRPVAVSLEMFFE